MMMMMMLKAQWQYFLRVGVSVGLHNVVIYFECQVHTAFFCMASCKIVKGTHNGLETSILMRGKRIPI